MATATKTKTWVTGEKLNFDDGNANWNTLFTFFGSGGSVVHNDGSQSFTADIGFPRSFATEDTEAVRKRQADMSPEITGVTGCWLHSGTHTPTVGQPYLMAGDSVILDEGFGIHTVELPASFSTDILTVVAIQGDDASGTSATQLFAERSLSDLNTIKFVLQNNGNAQSRLSWIVAGW